MRVDGHLVFHARQGAGPCRHGHRKLTKRAGRYWLVWRDWAYLLDWIPHEGIWAWKLLRGGPRGELHGNRDRPEKLMPPKKRQALGLENTPIAALPLESKLFSKYPKVLEHLVCTAYDDGSIRTPGAWRMDNKLIYLVFTLYDPDSGMRLPVNGTTCDECFALAEKLLGAEDCPWEVDRWLTEQLQKKERAKGRQKKKK